MPHCYLPSRIKYVLPHNIVETILGEGYFSMNIQQGGHYSWKLLEAPGMQFGSWKNSWKIEKLENS